MPTSAERFHEAMRLHILENIKDWHGEYENNLASLTKVIADAESRIMQELDKLKRNYEWHSVTATTNS